MIYRVQNGRQRVPRLLTEGKGRELMTDAKTVTADF
jgi:hypothetical protein